MNILPKKRWHVRTKENIARVRKDEAEAAEKERQEQLRIENADREARINVLKQKSKQKLVESGVHDTETEESIIAVATASEHINLFENFDHAITTTNKDHDNEVKEKKEAYEKKIGYLTYLGQDTNESQKKKNWYEVLPEESRFSRSSKIKDTYDKLVLKDQEGKPKAKEIDEKNGEIAWKAKRRLDPINAFKKYCHVNHVIKKVDTVTPTECTHEHTKLIEYKRKDKNNKKKHKKDNEKELKLQKLREARLKRERQEKYKTEMFLSGLNGPATSTCTEEQPVTKVKPKYNSQFNPELARQNYR